MSVKIIFYKRPGACGDDCAGDCCKRQAQDQLGRMPIGDDAGGGGTVGQVNCLHGTPYQLPDGTWTCVDDGGVHEPVEPGPPLMACNDGEIHVFHSDGPQSCAVIPGELTPPHNVPPVPPIGGATPIANPKPRPRPIVDPSDQGAQHPEVPAAPPIVGTNAAGDTTILGWPLKYWLIGGGVALGGYLAISSAGPTPKTKATGVFL